MSKLRLRRYPDPVLSRKAAAVKEVTDADRRLVEEMIETMKSSDGVGLAANQVGVLKRIFVFNTSPEGWRADAIINPVI
ncbi:MAG: peptide deformylase, partial [Candidatus Omnitrophica bacterium]|nr:peptide deformylase [Candidatus Omnitrophota bacterium]